MSSPLYGVYMAKAMVFSSFGCKRGKDFGKQARYPHPTFLPLYLSDYKSFALV